MTVIKKVLLTDEHVKAMKEDVRSWVEKGLETGGYIFGRLYDNGLAYVTSITGGGPKAVRTSISFSGDCEHATKVKEELRAQDPEVGLLGEYHSHPWSGEPILSGGDVKQLKESKAYRPWFLTVLMTKDRFQTWDLEAGKPERIPHQVVTAGTSKEGILDRILKVTQNEVLTRKTVLIAGLGSGGSVISKYLGCSGIGSFILIDNEELEVANVIRHEGGLEDIGKPKTEICKRLIESHNPFAVVECHNFDITKEVVKFEELAARADLIVGSSGNPRVNHIINKVSLEHNKPAVYGGVYERAKGGLVLAVLPNETACYNCLFKTVSEAYSVDKEAAERYGLSEDELHQQQGLWVNISFPCLILCNAALDILQSKKPENNLFLYDSSMEIKKLMVRKSENCAVCNKDSWIRSISETSSEKSGRLNSIRDRLRKILKKRDES